MLEQSGNDDGFPKIDFTVLRACHDRTTVHMDGEKLIAVFDSNEQFVGFVNWKD